ncbi:PilZ domain-containing protein [Methylococcus sp. EFPC2]|uniref:PilZ domain-containing protein n=1 Tax=Methylococcus sp. EFPC2 TaxID=2812648 RepID=UPI0019671F0D|nr:PilZ domain-containing protein [Methylococcus sp. EFPC2]QSA97459.1 PilZ domain-containing protein [Methylococcus sp. EFPC2]
MSSEPAYTANGERRRYFRIEDNIILFFREIDPRELNLPLDNAEPSLDTFSLTAELDLLTLESRSQMRRIERDYPPVAEFLQVLEQKIDLVARAILATDPELSRQPTRRVSLSASGLAFESEENYALGSLLELKMVLPPEMVGVQARGRVVYSQQTRGELPAYQVAVDFVELVDKDRDLLIRHVVRKQMRHLRGRNQADTADAGSQNP